MKNQKLLKHLNDLIDEWHEGDSYVPLHVFLKMSWEEYKLYIENSELPIDYERRIEK